MLLTKVIETLKAVKSSAEDGFTKVFFSDTQALAANMYGIRASRSHVARSQNSRRYNITVDCSSPTEFILEKYHF